LPKTNSSTSLSRFAFYALITLSILGFFGSFIFVIHSDSTQAHSQSSKKTEFTFQTTPKIQSQIISTPPNNAATLSNIEIAPVTTTSGTVLPPISQTNPLGTPQSIHVLNPVASIQLATPIVVPSNITPIPLVTPTTPAIIASVKTYIQTYFPANEVNKAIAIASCESGLNPSEVSAPNANGSRDWGVFELNDGGTLENLLAESSFSTTNLVQALNPQWNVQAAALLFSQRGWAPWVCAYKLGIVGQLYTNIPGPNANM
jgi:hypothetical protein